MDFKDVMSKRTNEELIKIVTINREDYQPLAVEAAELEIKNRGIEIPTINQIKNDLTNKIEEKMQCKTTKVSLLVRFANFILDSFFWFIIAFIITYPINANDSFQKLIGNIILLLTYFGYYCFLEIKYKKTFAKFITKTTVVTIYGREPEIKDIFIRTLCRFIPLDIFSFLASSGGFHDKFSNTTLIKDKF